MLNSEKIKQHFKSLKKPYAHNSNWFWKGLRDKEKKTFHHLVKTLNINSCLDLGAGSCEYSKILLNQGAKKLVCVDFHDMSIEKHPRIEYVFSPVENFHTNDKYDLILCLGILEFLEKPKNFLLKLKNFLKPQGKILLLLPLSLPMALAYKSYYLFKRISIPLLTLKNIHSFLIKHGFLLQKTNPSGNFFSGFAIYSLSYQKK
ncbi:MAG: class I SAM-dependent methyltransferase [Bdellovibrionales bacterium]|nr:class I SAM-dependent methyltransferase [Bdellovibrionales bacterium]